MTARKTIKKKVSRKTAVAAKTAIEKNGAKKKATKTKATKKKISGKKSVKVTKKIAKKETKAEKPSNKTLVLDPVLIINNAKTLSQKLNQLLKNDADLCIDASAVEMIDTAILQLLLAAINKAKSSKREVLWINPSDIFISNASLLGLTKPLGIS